MHRPRWEEQGFFRPDESASGEPFTMPMPPPNVTGRLHMGHAMFVTLQASSPAVMGVSASALFAALLHAVPLDAARTGRPLVMETRRTSWRALRACVGAPPCGCRAPTMPASPRRCAAVNFQLFLVFAIFRFVFSTDCTVTSCCMHALCPPQLTLESLASPPHSADGSRWACCLPATIGSHVSTASTGIHMR
jgi:tRNA synthetases class I (I, L, M and V)